MFDDRKIDQSNSFSFNTAQSLIADRIEFLRVKKKQS